MDDAEKAWGEWRDGDDWTSHDNVYDAFMAGRESQLSRIAALEAVIAELKRLDEWSSSPDWPGWNAVESVWAITRKAPSTVLDQMIREAKAEALTEAAARVRALFDMRTTLGKPSDEWLADRAAEYRNGDA